MTGEGLPVSFAGNDERGEQGEGGRVKNSKFKVQMSKFKVAIAISD
jgi:hypothetical protein